MPYLPGESDTGMFGGNSNWRGPVWMPVNAMIIRALLNFYLYYGDSFMIECPTGSGKLMTLFEVAKELGERLIVRSVEDSMKRGTVVLKSPDEPRNKHQSVTLLEAIEEFGFDCCIGGARRDDGRGVHRLRGGDGRPQPHAKHRRSRSRTSCRPSDIGASLRRCRSRRCRRCCGWPSASAPISTPTSSSRT